MPYPFVTTTHRWGANGYSGGDSANELAQMSLDPNVHIQDVKAFTCDIRPGHGRAVAT